MRRLKDLMIYSDGGKIWNNLNKTQRRDYIYNSLLKKGYSNIHAAAITGNLQQENGTFGTTRKNLEGSGAIGIAQWLGSRREQLKKDYTDWYDIDKQIEFIDREIKGDRNAWTNNIGGKKGFFNAKDVETATKIFRKDFERPGEREANDPLRIKYAYSVLGKEKDYKPYVESGNSNVVDTTNNVPSNITPANYSHLQSNNISLTDLNRFDFNTLPDELKQTVVTNQRLQQEKELQEKEATRVQQENLAIQQAIESKKQERESMLAMLPVAQFVPSGNFGQSSYNQLLTSQSGQVMQKGGRVVSEIWEEETGTPWSEAAKQGLSDGSYNSNIKLLQRLKQGEFTKKSQDIAENNTSKQGEEVEYIYPNGLRYNSEEDSYDTVEIEEVIIPYKNKDLLKVNDIDYIKRGVDYFNPKIAYNPEDYIVQKENPVLKDVLNMGRMMYDTSKSTLQDNLTKVTDFTQQGMNYIDRHYLDNTEVNTKNIKVNSNEPVKSTNQPIVNLIEDQINLTDIKVGKGNAASGVINLKTNKFSSRNRGNLDEVEGGRGIAITTFNPMSSDLENSYKDFKEVLALKKDGSVEIMNRKNIKKDNVESITRADKMPWDKIEVVNRNGKEYIKVRPTVDFAGKIVDMGDYNSGIGVGKTKEDYIPIEDANKYSKLIGGKVIIKSGDQQLLVAGSFKNMYDVYQELAKKTKKTPEVYKLDNGSFNTTYFKNTGNIDSEDLRAHQNRNTAGGHSLILLNNNK